MDNEKLPQSITVLRSITYDIDSDLLNTIAEIKGNDEPIEVDDVLNFIEDWVYEDFRSPVEKLRYLSFLDENGNEL